MHTVCGTDTSPLPLPHLPHRQQLAAAERSLEVAELTEARERETALEGAAREVEALRSSLESERTRSASLQQKLEDAR